MDVTMLSQQQRQWIIIRSLVAVQPKNINMTLGVSIEQEHLIYMAFSRAMNTNMTPGFFKTTDPKARSLAAA